MTPPPPARRSPPATPAPAAPAFSPGSGAERLADETRERFLREIVARVPAERAVECFLFPPIRQGGVESGIAVIAVRREGAPTAVAAPTLVDLTPDGDPTEAAALDPAVPLEGEAALTGDAAPAALAPTDGLIEDAPDRDAADADAPVADAPVADTSAGDAPAGDAPDGDAPDGDAPRALDARGEPMAEAFFVMADDVPLDVVDDAQEVVEDGDALLEPPVETPTDAPGVIAADAAVETPAGPPAPGAPTPAPERHTVFVARYRLTVKGPERGRWEVDVREEADAPLVTVEEVVRGVGRRAGDAADPTRLDGVTLATLGLPAPPRLPGAPGAPGR